MASIDVDLTQMARLFHALSDPTRLQLLQRISGRDCCVCELQDALDAAQSRLSFHLKILKEAGLVKDRKEGRWVYYTVDPDKLDEIGAILSELGSQARAGGST